MTEQPFLDALERELRAAHPRRREARRRAAVARAARRAPVVLAVVALLAGGVAVSGALDGSGEPGVDQAPRPAAPAVPASIEDIRVAVLNGTTRSGLARSVADRLTAFGARVGTITNAADQSVARTRVLHADGSREPAVAIAQTLGVNLVARLDETTRAIASEDVVVIAGNDLGLREVTPGATVGCPRVGGEETLPSVDAGRDVAAGPLAILGAKETAGRRRDAFGGLGYKLAVTVADGEIATLRVPRPLQGRVGLVYTQRAQEAVAREGIGGAPAVMDFGACSRMPGGSPRTGWPGGIVTDRPRCATLLVKVLGEPRSRRLRVPLGRTC